MKSLDSSTEIAESRERFEKWWLEDEQRDTTPITFSTVRETWQAAERDTRERCAQIADERARQLHEDKEDVCEDEVRLLAERIRKGPESKEG